MDEIFLSVACYFIIRRKRANDKNGQTTDRKHTNLNLMTVTNLSILLHENIYEDIKYSRCQT